MAKTALFAVLEHPDRDHLCRTLAEVLRILKERGIEVKLQGYMLNDDCWRVEAR